MNYSLRIASVAEQDLTIAFKWYEKQKQGLGKLFEQEVVYSFSRVADNPKLYQVRYGKVRIFWLKRFPFGIHYTITKNEILVLAVFHSSQGSSSWRQS